MIRSNLNHLRAEKAKRESRKLPYRVMADETGLSIGTFQRLMTQEFSAVEKDTMEKLCVYFDCSVGDLLEHVPEPNFIHFSGHGLQVEDKDEHVTEPAQNISGLYEAIRPYLTEPSRLACEDEIRQIDIAFIVLDACQSGSEKTNERLELGQASCSRWAYIAIPFKNISPQIPDTTRDKQDHGLPAEPSKTYGNGHEHAALGSRVANTQEDKDNDHLSAAQPGVSFQAKTVATASNEITVASLSEKITRLEETILRYHMAIANTQPSAELTEAGSPP
jgi:putative transcriptional regulator